MLNENMRNQLMHGQNNANEGLLFTPQNIVTEDGFIIFLRNSFPLFTEDDISKLPLYYPSSNNSVMSTPGFATSGSTNPTALNESSFANGQQQIADVRVPSTSFPKSTHGLTSSQSAYAETPFVCPAYWLTEAFTNNGRVGYTYQYSVIGAQHGADGYAIFGPPTPNQSPDFVRGFMSMRLTSSLSFQRGIHLLVVNNGS